MGEARLHLFHVEAPVIQLERAVAAGDHRATNQTGPPPPQDRQVRRARAEQAISRRSRPASRKLDAQGQNRDAEWKSCFMIRGKTQGDLSEPGLRETLPKYDCMVGGSLYVI